MLGASGVVAADNTEQFLNDWGGKYSGSAIAVVRPGSTDEVSAVLRLCNEVGLAVVPQGGNTGLVGGSVPLKSDHPEGRDCIVLSLARMNTIESIDVERATLTTQAGVTVQALQEAAASAGLLFGPDWGARGTAQIGGGISTNAGGLNVLRWGSMREQILGLEVVLPDGRIWDGLRALRKDSTGLDLKQLFISTEGTFGIVPRAVFKLHPLPTEHLTALVALPSLDVLLPFFAHARTEGAGLVSAFELMPEEGLIRVLANVPQAQRPLEEKSEWYVLVRLSGGDGVIDTMSHVLSTAADASLIVDAAVASTAEQENNLWLIRDELPAPVTFDKRGNRHKFDIAIPVDKVVEFLDSAGPAVEAIVSGTRTYAFGHVGDGNLHFNVFPGTECDVEEFDARSSDLERAIDELTWSFNGTISAEHGIGQLMRNRLATQKSDIEVELMRRVKTALDPNGIMNPGKVLPPD